MLVACIKYAEDPGTIVTPGTDTVTAIKFYNLVEQGKLKIKLNGKVVADSLAEYYPSNYITAKADSNNVQLFKLTSGDTTILNLNIGMIKGKKYSCFIYKQGYDWKISLVNDKLTLPDSGYAGVRILDFRTQSFTNYVNVKLFSIGFFTYGDVAPFTYRHFLDHTSYDVYTQFVPVYARPDYNVVVYNSTANLSSRSNINLSSRKLYSIILMTPSSITADSTANKYLFSDVQQHN
jgi:hypothetical protein